ncbi:MAG: aldo/keto reductase [Chloroflexi bacterium]|nr:aldo/keto reductase [Chloroflexota bacterium]
MDYRTMGSSDLTVSALGFGAWEIGGNYGGFEESEVIAAVRRALDLGVTLFDTARAYGAGRSEELLSRALGPRRKDIILVTKCGLPTRPGLKPDRDGRYRTILEDVEHSLRDLRTDYVDLLLQHWPDPETPIEESMRALVDLQQSGKARYVGVSNYHPQMLREARRHAPIVTNQTGYNLFDRRWEHQMFPTARDLGLGVMAYGPMAHGLLTGAFTAETVFEEGDWRRLRLIFGQALFTPENFPKNIAVVEQLREIAHDLGTELAPLAIAWVLRDPIVSVALLGTRRPEELEHNVKALDVHLTPDVLKRIDIILAAAAGQTNELPA